MMTTPFLRRLVLAGAVLLAATGCTESALPTTVRAPSGEVFNTTRHVVIEGIQHDGFETITVLAHLCRAVDSSCPDGDEELVVLASKHLAPGQIYLDDPEVYLEPPDQCVTDAMACRMSVVHCEFANEADQREAGFCLPSKASVAQWGASTTSTGGGHPCVERRAERSHHIDYGCVTGASAN
jgi:hypothetical protein